MRGAESEQGVMFSVVALEDRIPADHPLRAIRGLVDPVLRELAPRFATLYATSGRPSIPPEQLLRALLLQILYTIRSERQLIEQLDYNLLFRWFVGLAIDAPVWHPTSFTKNRDRLLAGHIAEGFLSGVVREAARQGLVSGEHFTIDGTLLEAWASQKSIQPIARAADQDTPDRPDDPERRTPSSPRTGGHDGPGGARAGAADRNPSVDFRGERRRNATHRSTTDPDARLAKKGGAAAKLSYQASVLMENRHGLVVQTAVGLATGTAEVDQALEMLSALAVARPKQFPQGTVGLDKGYDTHACVAAIRALAFTPHVAQQTKNRRSAIDGRTTRAWGYAESQRRRKLVEQGFGWSKTVGLLRKLHHRGTALVDWVFTFTMAAYNLVRMRTLQALAGPA